MFTVNICLVFIPFQSIAKLIFRQCGLNAYSNYYDCFVIMQKAVDQKLLC